MDEYVFTITGFELPSLSICDHSDVGPLDGISILIVYVHASGFICENFSEIYAYAVNDARTVIITEYRIRIRGMLLHLLSWGLELS